MLAERRLPRRALWTAQPSQLSLYHLEEVHSIKENVLVNSVHRKILWLCPFRGGSVRCCDGLRFTRPAFA